MSQLTPGWGAPAPKNLYALRANLTAQASIFAGIITADAAGASPMELTGPADGRTVAYADVGEGTLGVANATPAVQTHILAPRGETFPISTRKPGGAPVTIPHP